MRSTSSATRPRICSPRPYAASIPGVKIAIGPPIENGFYYDFDFPEPIREEDLEKIEAEIEPRAEGRPRLDARGDLARRGEGALRAEGEPYKVELVDTAEGDISLYTQGEASPISAADRTCRTRSRSRRSS